MHVTGLSSGDYRTNSFVTDFVATLPLTGSLAAPAVVCFPVDPSLRESPVLLSVTLDDSAWFWTTEWQAGEVEADRDIAEGRIERFTTEEDFLNSLD